jgi:hypothetical protein
MSAGLCYQARERGMFMGQTKKGFSKKEIEEMNLFGPPKKPTRRFSIVLTREDKQFVIGLVIAIAVFVWLML